MRARTFAIPLSIVLSLVLSPVLSLLLPAREAQAQQTPFLITPYYGNATITARFDHHYPTYGRAPNSNDNIFQPSDGAWYQNPPPVDPVNCQGVRCYDGHDGYDFVLPGNGGYDRVLAAADGTVTLVQWQNLGCHRGDLCGWGLYIEITHSNGYVMRYAHLSAAAVSPGQYVVAGQIIGTSGNTGASTGAHLHFGVRRFDNNREVDPFGWTGAGNDPWAVHAQGATSWFMWAGGEFAGSPLADPTPAGSPAIYVDDTTNNTGGFSKGSGGPFNSPCQGNCGGWTSAAAGLGGDMYYTPADRTRAAGGDQWARWQPTIPLPGVYEVWVHVPPVNATSWQAPYVIDTGSGQFTAYGVDQLGLYSQWVCIGAHHFLSGLRSVYVTDATGESPTYPGRRVGVDQVKFIQRPTYPVYLPDIKENYYGWNSSIVVRNNSTSKTARVYTTFLRSNGESVYSQKTDDIAPRGSVVVDFPGTCYYCRGSAVVAASEDVSVVVDNHNSSTGRTYSYNGVAAADPLNPGWGEVGTTLYAPSIYNNQWGYNSTLRVMNTGSATATVQVHFKRRLTCGNCVDTTRSYTIVSGGSEEIPASSVLGTASWYGSLVIESSNGQPVAAVVHTSGSQFNRAYNTVSAGNGVIYLPMAYKNQWSMTSGLIVQNVGSQSTAVTVALYDRENNGQPHATIVLSNIAAGRAEGLWLGDLDNLVLPDGWAGWVKLTSQNGQPLAVTSHTKRYESQCAYAGAFQSGQAVILPSAAKNADGPTTGYIVLNTSGSLSVQVAPVYYAVSGGISLTPSSYWLGWLEAKGQYQADDSLPDGWAGSILLPAQSGESLVAVMRQDRGTTTTSCYNGVVR